MHLSDKAIPVNQEDDDIMIEEIPPTQSKSVTVADLVKLDTSIVRKKDRDMSPSAILTELFALEDFSIDTETAEQERITISEDKIVLEKVTYERTTLQGKNIEKYLRPILMMISLGVLAHKPDLVHIMQQILYHVHAQESHPQFHSLCRTDINRNIISMYSRPFPEADSNWIRDPFKHALSRLNRHARNLTLFVVQVGMKALKPQYCKSKGKVVLRMHDDDNEALLYRENNKLVHIRQQLKSHDDYSSCLDEHVQEANALINLVNERKVPALSAVDNQSLDAKHWKVFFDFSQLLCAPTNKQTRYLKN